MYFVSFVFLGVFLFVWRLCLGEVTLMVYYYYMYTGVTNKKKCYNYILVF